MNQIGSIKTVYHFIIWWLRVALAFGLCYVGLRVLWVLRTGCTLRRMDFHLLVLQRRRSLREPTNITVFY
jgi:hypothetical protein